MIKEQLKQLEPIAYLSLENDLKSNHISHSYLFCGELNPFKKDVAYLLAQSIIENNNDFACEQCATCKRIKDDKYYDLIYIDGYKETIKKEHILRIKDEFNRTSLEDSNKKIYIIDNINNSSPKVLNMLLKYMEEPSSENTFGILISDNVDSLLETVVSRCKKIQFVSKDFSYLISSYQDKGFSYIDAYLLSNIKHELIDIDVDDNNYILAKEYVYKTIENLNNKAYIPILFSREYYKSVDKDSFKTSSDYYLNIMLMLLNDALANNQVKDDEYMYYANKLKEYDVCKLLNIILDAISKTNTTVNRQLLFDQIASKIIL